MLCHWPIVVSMKPKVIIVPHTHWDREWYLPFQRFRLKLVKLIDELLDILNHHEYAFMLDGQTILIEDYLEIRPEKRDEFLKRIQEGKISVLCLLLFCGGTAFSVCFDMSFVMLIRLDFLFHLFRCKKR